jgi:hypothetical protein
MAPSGTKSAGRAVARAAPPSSSRGRSGGSRQYRDAPRKPAQEPIPVISGRFLVAAGIVGAMILIPFSPLGRMLEAKGPMPTDVARWAEGAESEVKITLVTADYNLLTCAADKSIDGAHCAYKSEAELWPRDPTQPLDDNKKSIIQPYRTWPDNKLVLVAGLWAEPTVAMRLHREPPQAVPAKKLARFVVECQMKFLGKLETPKLRWGAGQGWMSEGPAWVARPVSCKLRES